MKLLASSLLLIGLNLHGQPVDLPDPLTLSNGKKV
jgi:hypothetical protein